MRILLFILSLLIAFPAVASTKQEIVLANIAIKELVNCQAHLEFMVRNSNIYNSFQKMYGILIDESLKNKMINDYLMINDTILVRLRKIPAESGLTDEYQTAREMSMITMIVNHLEINRPLQPDELTKYLMAQFTFIESCVTGAKIRTEMISPEKVEPATDPTPTVPKVKP